ncbi:hypothetical protein ACHAW6_003585 [Cyclotella cf. meneghiniana]
MKNVEMSLLTASGTVDKELSLMSTSVTWTCTPTATPPRAKSSSIMPKKRKISTRLYALTNAGTSPLLSTLSMAWLPKTRKRLSNALPGYLQKSGAKHTRIWQASSAHG